jgi:MFS family permease
LEESSETNQQGKAVTVRPWSSLFIRDYALIWTSGLFAGTASQMRQVANLYQVYQLSGSSIKLGLTGFFQSMPFIIFGLVGGVLADAVDRKKLIMTAQFLNLVPAFALGLLTIRGSIQVWHIYVFTMMTSLVQVFGGPARMAIVPVMVPRTHLMNAVTLNTLTHQASLLFGPALAGLFIDLIGLDFTYFLSAALFVPAILAVFAIRTPGKPAGAQRSVGLRNAVEGVKFIWVQRIILSLLLLDFGTILMGFYQPLLPVFASDVFRVSASGLGLLYAAPATGLLFGSALLLLVGDIKRKGAIAVVAAILFAGNLALLGSAPWFWLGVLAVGALGFFDSISVTMRRTVVQLSAPDGMRGRANSLITVFAQSANALGALIAGTAAAFLGAPKTLVLGSVLCVIIVLSISRAIPQLWHYRSE